MNTIIHSIARYKYVMIVAVILLVGAYLRLYDIRGYMTFLGDEGRDMLVVKRMIVDHKFTLLGPTASVGGFFLGPIYYYFMLPFLWAWQLDPVGPSTMVALFGIATIGLVYVVGKKLFGAWPGIIAASLYALSPVVIAYSRSSWNPNLVPFFTLVLVYFLFRLAHEKKISSALWIGVMLGVGLQLHYLFLFLFVLVAVWYLLIIRRMHWIKILGLTALGFVIGYAPFLAFEVRHGFPNTQSIIRFLLAGKETGYEGSTFFVTIGDVVFRLFGRLMLRFPEKAAWPNFPSWQIPVWIALTRTIAFSSIVYVMLAAIRKIRAQQHVSYVLLALWFLVPVMLFGFYQKGIYDYYFGIIFAVPFLMVGAVAGKLLEWKMSRWVIVAMWIGLLYFNWLGRPFVYPPNRQLDQAQAISAEALAHTDGKPFNFALVTRGNSDHAFRYFFEIWGRKPVTIENETIDPERKTVTDQLIVICEDPACQPLGNSLWEIAGFGRAQIAGSWDVPFVRIFKLVPYTGE